MERSASISADRLGDALLGLGGLGGAHLDLVAGVGQGGLLAPHVLVERGQGRGDLLLVALEGVDLGRHLGLLGPDLGPLGPRALTGRPCLRAGGHRGQRERADHGGEGHRDAASCSRSGRAH